MTNSEIIEAINNLVYLVQEFMPDPVYVEHYQVDEVIEQAQLAVNFLIKEGG